MMRHRLPDARVPAGPRPPVELSVLVARIVEQAQRLRPPCSRNPEQFHDDKGELVGALLELQHQMRERRP